MRLKDVIFSGTKEDLKKGLSTLAKRLQAIGEILYQRVDLGEACRVYSAIGESTAKQLELMSRLLDEPIEVSANICRTVFEINIVFRYCLSSPERLGDYLTQAATDEISIYKSIKILKNNETDPRALLALDEHINRIRDTLRKHAKKLKPERINIAQMAKEVGVESDYEALYGLYSKYVHASAWFVLRKREHIDLPAFRVTIQIHTQIYAIDTLQRLEDISRK